MNKDKYSSNLIELRLEMQNFIYSIEQVKRRLANAEAELLAIKGGPEQCQFCDDNLPATTAIKGHPACEPCSSAYWAD